MKGIENRAMMERYSHIRMLAKREAVEALMLPRRVENSEVVTTKSPKNAKTAHFSVSRLLKLRW